MLRVPFIRYYKFRKQQLVIWEAPKLFFMGYADAVLKNTYRALGQNSVRGILFINHGPQCLHKALVNNLTVT